MKFFTFLFLIFSIPSIIWGQLTIKNHMEYTRWEEYDRTIFENWSDLSYQKKNVQFGLRYEINRPPDPFVFPRDTLLHEYELTYGYAELDYKNITARVGNFYSMFGRGLILRTYEDRDLRVDNNIQGAKLILSQSVLNLQVLAGRMRDKYNRCKDTIYGLDGEFSINSDLHIGGSYILQDNPDHEKNQIWSSRFYLIENWGDIYGEIARSDWHEKFSYYAAVNAAFSQFTLTMEYKDYNRLSFRNSYGTEYNAAPSLTRQHTFTLLNRHPHALNQNDEKGYQLEITYIPNDAWEFVVNHSKTFTHERQRIFEEYYGEVHHYFGERIDSRLAAAWNYDFATNTENITPVVDLYYNLNQRNQLHLSYQHQHTINKFDKSEFDNELLMIEYSRSPWFSIAMVGEYTNKDQLKNITLDRNYWLYGNATFSYWRNQQLSILYGSRQAGFVCVGGICRYEPEFEGFEIRLINRF